MEISADRVKELREKSGAGVMDCKRALVEADGDLDRAAALLRQRGLAQVAKRAGREATEGIVDAYIHAGGKIGVIVEVNCETDFVARTPDFRALAHDIAMQIAATNPPSVGDAEGDGEGGGESAGSTEDLPLLSQPFIKDPKRTVADLVRDTAARTGENIVIRRFTRYELGA
ncbi:MAG TPA: translation elongation factor Ts [Chloroflexota bacterium]|nr:translation elongation factor Ts [Chloroflexota bacterium]